MLQHHSSQHPLVEQEYKIISRQLQKFGFASLKDYYLSYQWQEKRSRFKKAKKKMLCYCCNSPHRLELHHQTYERLCEEYHDDVVWVCDECHEQIHLMYEVLPDGPDRLFRATQAWKEAVELTPVASAPLPKRKRGEKDDKNTHLLLGSIRTVAPPAGAYWRR